MFQCERVKQDYVSYLVQMRVCVCASFLHTSVCAPLLVLFCVMHLAWGPGLPGCVNKLKQQIMFKSLSLRPGKTEIHYS